MVFNILKEVYGVRISNQVENSCPLPNSEVLMVEDNEEDIRVYLKANILTGNTMQLMACAELAIRCVKVNPVERLSMMEAAKELRRIIRCTVVAATKVSNGIDGPGADEVSRVEMLSSLIGVVEGSTSRVGIGDSLEGADSGTGGMEG
ncbi:hypothetical protein HHK36_022258 [Tetracentron sinense]|uniref:Uncharacterized protein n=1 Tax=Tetracentron sinense TaxID=13715 RepID=A0A835D646_TETSI|nr:hypothetical protein HHK36_022258 [Tetracentron sinense]